MASAADTSSSAKAGPLPEPRPLPGTGSLARLPFLVVAWLVVTCLPATGDKAPPVATFSLVARDPDTGELGVAVQSKIVAVGTIVPFARAGVGAVATQALANTRYGPVALALLEGGATPAEIIEIFREQDPDIALRQVGILSATGETAHFTGEECLAWAGSVSGEDYTVQGNILTGPEVIGAMAKAFEESEGVLAERMLAALEAGQEAGGDKRGRQSAALLIVREGWGYGGQNDRFRDLRVDEHAEPIRELRRVYEKHRALFPRPDAGRDRPPGDPAGE